MVSGVIYGYEANCRTIILRAIAKENKLDIKLEHTNPGKGELPKDYAKLNPLGLIPTFVGSDGFILTEVIAIAIYQPAGFADLFDSDGIPSLRRWDWHSEGTKADHGEVTSQNEKTTLLGKNKEEYAQILKWMSLANSYLLPQLAGWFRPLIGKDPYNKSSVEKSKVEAFKAIDLFEVHLLSHTYLVGERFTLADLFAASIASRGYELVFDQAFREKYPCLTRWWSTITNQPIYSAVTTPPAFRDEAVQYVAPKKEPKAKKEGAPAAPKAKSKAVEKDEDEEDEAPAAPKAKHPLESLDKPTMILDDWKRKYSNEETPVALAWFWQNASFDKDYSLHRVDYKYNDELTQVFMTSNLIGGFFARLEASRKFIFGACSVYGTANDSIIRGAFLVRGQDSMPAFEVAPDAESYEFTKLDPANAKDKEFVDSMWSWEKPIEEKGKEYQWADGKVFK